MRIHHIHASQRSTGPWCIGRPVPEARIRVHMRYDDVSHKRGFADNVKVGEMSSPRKPHRLHSLGSLDKLRELGSLGKLGDSGKIGKLGKLHNLGKIDNPGNLGKLGQNQVGISTISSGIVV